MKGYRTVFSTLRGREHANQPICDWFVETAKKLGLAGITIIDASLGYGRDTNMHSAGFFETVDQPVEIIILADEMQTKQLFEILRLEKLSLVYATCEVDFGMSS